jgi:hypothetical protein
MTVRAQEPLDESDDFVSGPLNPASNISWPTTTGFSFGAPSPVVGFEELSLDEKKKTKPAKAPKRPLSGMSAFATYQYLLATILIKPYYQHISISSRTATRK